MTMLTALEHNYGLTAPTVTHKKAAYSRAQKKYVLKNDNLRDTESVRKNIIDSMNDNIRNNDYLTLLAIIVDFCIFHFDRHGHNEQSII